MASLVITLRVDPTTGKKDILVDYTSDADALPMEHEEEHRKIIAKLIAGGVVAAEEVGRVIVATPGAAEEPAAATADERTPQKAK
jgi:hypothetical protein